VKQLASVETLGSTTVICSDKTGTLTLNKMTARELVCGDQRHVVAAGPSSVADADPCGPALNAMALCSDADLRDGAVVGDPTEGALVRLAVEAGVDVAGLRGRFPRVAEVPFDSATKLMATFHDLSGEQPSAVVRMYVKGAPDVLLRRTSASGMAATDVERENTRLGEAGLRVLALAQRDLDAASFQAHLDAGADLAALVTELSLLGLVAIADPARPEAGVAISACRDAGIAVKMVTGDHPRTAAAIGHELGLDGTTVTGAELDAMTDAELAARVEAIAVFARVTPEHKLRLVQALRRDGHVVAMTGDGVNDAPALKAADIGVAMGITGTEVTKQAATMVLTDDNFATIVRAVRQGRVIYDNILKFVRFQLSTTLGLAYTFLVASVLDIADGTPFTAIQILWVNLIMDGPPAMALGVDPPAVDVMARRPRPAGERIVGGTRLVRLLVAAAIMGTGTLLVLHQGSSLEASAVGSGVARTMAFTTFVCFQLFNLLNARDENASLFRRATLRNRYLWLSIAAVLGLQVAAVHAPPLQQLFGLAPLTLAQWLVCGAVASSILWLDEARKLITRLARA
jgi:Ca2+-transporting ATPase